MVIVVAREELEEVPQCLEDFFNQFPSICSANLALTNQEHVNMWREQVLFIKQRQQATSDYRENPRVRWIGSHAAMTCHIVVMRHRLTGVVSLGHFDNFCCWQFGEESSAHRDGLDIMVDEIAALSCGNVDQIEVTVVGGYSDARGDAARNSLSLLNSLHDHWAFLNIKHFAVGKYNTTYNPETGLNEAILKGIAIDLERQEIFPAIYNWGQFDDFKTQLQTKFRTHLSVDEDPENQQSSRITADSTFKPKSLKNQSRSLATVVTDSKSESSTSIPLGSRNLKRTLLQHNISNVDKSTAFRDGSAFKVKLRPVSSRPSLGHWGSSSSRKSRRKSGGNAQKSEQ